jgi:C4-type Zn-finger protein
MTETRECPMCAGTMRIVVHEEVEHIPGQGQTRPHLTQEWVCRECDYFEEAEETKQK